MKTLLTPSKRLALLPVVLAVCLGAQAQTPPAPSAPSAPSASTAPTYPSAPPPPGGPTGQTTRTVSASTLGGPNYAAPEVAIERLHQQLQLSPEQEPAWQRYVRELDTATGMMLRERPVAALADEGAAQQLGRVSMQLQNRLAAMEAIEKAARELQAVLNPDQQKVANMGLLATLPPLLASTPIAGMAGGVREDNRGRTDGAMRQRRGGMGGGMGGGMRP